MIETFLLLMLISSADAPEPVILRSARGTWELPPGCVSEERALAAVIDSFRVTISCGPEPFEIVASSGHPGLWEAPCRTSRFYPDLTKVLNTQGGTPACIWLPVPRDSSPPRGQSMTPPPEETVSVVVDTVHFYATPKTAREWLWLLNVATSFVPHIGLPPYYRQPE